MIAQSDLLWSFIRMLVSSYRMEFEICFIGVGQVQRTLIRISFYIWVIYGIRPLLFANRRKIKKFFFFVLRALFPPNNNTVLCSFSY